MQNDFQATIINKQEIEYTPKQALDNAKAITALIEQSKKEMSKAMKEKRGR